jgi:hypothetical protein
MKRLLTITLLLLSILSLSAFLHERPGDEPVPIPPSKQRTGDPGTGFTYLTTGDYLKSGIP